MVSKEELISKLVQEAGKSLEEVQKLISEKQKDFTGVSEEGIINLVARDLTINLYASKPQELKITNIVPNMRNITFIGKITDVSPVREFNRDGNPGKVQNLVIEDETGKIRLSLWNDEVDKYKFSINDVVKVENVRTRKDNLGMTQASIGYSGNIAKTDAVVNVKEPKSSLSGLEENDDVNIEATLLHIFERPLIYYFCPQCRQKLQNGECMVHGKVEPRKTLIVSGLLDDGTSTINAAFFGETAEKLLGKKTDEIESKLSETPINDYVMSLDILTKKFKIFGSTKMNQLTNDLELRVRTVEKS
ncbi:hypothetical protein ACFLQN_01490 [Candidatus Aenigmatarchaeota archaeon]